MPLDLLAVTGKTEEEHRADQRRVAGTVGHGKFGHFVEAERGGKYRLPSNSLSRNRYRGIGSQTRDFFYGVGDVEKKEPFMGWLGMDNNTTNSGYVGVPIAPVGTAVTFVPQTTGSMVTKPDNGGIVIFTQTNSKDGEKESGWMLVPEDFLGIACNVAIDKSKPLPEDRIPWAPVL
tara:strand:- start:190 stop:717 length:528 start_codon:yes stop_codon:yes gene_type:complete